MTVTYDAGALVAAERGNEYMRSRHGDAIDAGISPIVPAAVVWQVWRNGTRQAELARLLRSCMIEPIDDSTARAVGELLGRAGSSDGVDAAVVVSAARRGGIVYTSDPGDLRKLMECLGPVTTPFVLRRV
jgi:hypothetical protein